METSPLPKRDIVVIGASAGGVEALRGFFHALPAGLEAAFLVVLHIPADTPSQLDRVLGYSTQLPVDIAQDGEPIRNGHVYVASADRHLMATAQGIRLSRGPKEGRSQPSVDVLFRSTAKDLDALGFADHDAKRWEQLVQRPYGIILVTGPTGSGKTTTLYSTLKRLATEAVNVSTVEDPIEMIEPSFNQTQVQPHLDFDFPEGLRALMRQDPDIIMVGEIRDLQTAEMAVQAALTGHLVFSTLHTNDAPSAVSRLMELGVPSYLINATLLGVLAQRLVRTLCSHCRQPDENAKRETLAELVKPWHINGGYRPYKPVGCVDCRMTGFRGRMGLYELLTVTESFKEKVSKEPNIDALRRQAITEGMRPLRLAGALKVAEGLTTIEEILATTPPLA